MPTQFRIWPEHRLVAVRIHGFVSVAEVRLSMMDYAADPGFDPGHRQLIDLGGVTGYERDYPAILALAAWAAGALRMAGREPVIVYLAPNRASQIAARALIRSWQGQTGAVVLMLAQTGEAMDFLGLGHLPYAAVAA